METWKPIPGFETAYEVSDQGRVRNSRTGAMKKPTLSKTENRYYVMLWALGKPKLMKVHRLVLLAFVGQPPGGMECCHNDGDSTNNLLRNLRWDTHSANMLDKAAHGTSNRGEQCATAKLTTAQVLAIRADSRMQKHIAADYGVRQSAISRIKSGVRWAHL